MRPQFRIATPLFPAYTENYACPNEESSMKMAKWTAATALTLLLSSGSIAFAQGKGHGKGRDKHGDDDGRAAQFYKDHDREVIRRAYGENPDNLARALAKRDRLSPALAPRLAPPWPL